MSSKWPLQFPVIKTASSVKIKVVSVSLGLALLGILAAYFRRKKKRVQNQNVKRQVPDGSEQNNRLNHISYSNGDITMGRGRHADSPSGSSQHSLSKHNKSQFGSTSSLAASSVSTVTHAAIDTGSLSPVQLCHLGFETLQTAVSYWEDASMKLSFTEDQSKPALLDTDTVAVQHQLERLLDSAYRMIDSYERQCERQADQVAFDSAITAFTTEMDRMSERRSLDTGSQSDQDSFVSATDMANLSDLDNHREMFKHLPLYEAGLLELKHGAITCRTLRTEMTHCLSDTEFLAKLHCLRLAMEIIFQNGANKDYFRRMGRQILGDILIKADREPDDFFVAYEEMMDYVYKSSNWPQMEEELKGRGVKSFTFYDILLDFILMDAFDDLANPPSSVITVVQNRWLSNGFKETALSTAVWSVLKAKRRMLKVPDGFIKRFYGISEHTSPVLAWGFLGPDSPLKEMCLYFKDIVLGFISDIFSFEKCRYTTLDDLAEDIVRLGKERCEAAVTKLSS